MSLFFNYNQFQNVTIQAKTPTKSNDGYVFVPLRYKNNEIFIKTPKIIVPFGLNTFEKNNMTYHSYSLSFTDSDIDPKIQKFLTFVKNVDKYVQHVYFQRYGKHDNTCEFKSSLKDYNGTPLFCVKINDKISELYDETNTLCDITKISQQCSVISLVSLSGIWINQNEYGVCWKLYQAKIYPPFRPLGGISLIKENIQYGTDSHQLSPSFSPQSSPPLPSPPPPPPPLPPQNYGSHQYHQCVSTPDSSSSKIENYIKKFGTVSPLIACFDIINQGSFQLKKTLTNNYIKKETFPTISLTEILKIKNNLRKKS